MITAKNIIELIEKEKRNEKEFARESLKKKWTKTKKISRITKLLKMRRKSINSLIFHS